MKYDIKVKLIRDEFDKISDVSKQFATNAAFNDELLIQVLDDIQEHIRKAFLLYETKENN